MKYRWQLHDRKTLFRKYFQLDEYLVSHELFDGGDSDPFTREVFERGSAVAVIPYDPKTRQVVLIEQFRIGALSREEHPWLIECVAGIIEAGETLEQVAIRETSEETGCQVRELIPIHQYYVSPGGSSETCSLFCGLVDAPGQTAVHGLPHENEDIRVFSITSSQAFEWLRHGKINNSMTLIALHWLQANEARILEAFQNT